MQSRLMKSRTNPALQFLLWI